MPGPEPATRRGTPRISWLRWSGWRLGLLAWLCAFTACVGAARAQDSREYAIKAAFLLNFTRYVRWPEQSFIAADDPFDFCILGIDPFGDVLERKVAGQISQGREIRIRRIPDVRHAVGCHLVFIGAGEAKRQPESLATLQNQPVLTVGEADRFLEQGGIIRLLVVEDNVRFEINAGQAKRSQLRISSRLLELARRTVGA